METIKKIFVGNKELCNNVPEKLISHLVNTIGAREPHVTNLNILKSIASLDGVPMKRTQEKILSSLSTAEGNVLVFYNDDVSFKELLRLMSAPEEDTASRDTLTYHITLIALLASCAEGKNSETALKCQNLLLLEDIARVLLHPSTTLEVKSAYVNFLSFVYAQAEDEIREATSFPILFSIFENFLADFKIVISENFENKSTKGTLLLTDYLAQPVVQCLTFFYGRHQSIRIPSANSSSYTTVCS